MKTSTNKNTTTMHVATLVKASGIQELVSPFCLNVRGNAFTFDVFLQTMLTGLCQFYAFKPSASLKSELANNYDHEQLLRPRKKTQLLFFKGILPLI